MIEIQFDVGALRHEIDSLVAASDLRNTDCLLYIQVTRGVAPRQHAYPRDIYPTCIMYALPKTLPDVNAILASVITMPDYRWSRCDIKMTSLLGNVMANDHAIRQGCFEALLIRDGLVTEASHCNVFFVKDGIIYTHPANEHILDGITRKIVFNLCRDMGLKIIEEAIREGDITKMDEAFLTGTTTQIASIKQVNEHKYYDGDEPGSITKKLQVAFLELKRNKNS